MQGSEEGGGMNLPAAQPACPPLPRAVPTREGNPSLSGRAEQHSLREGIHFAPWGLISLTESCFHLAGVEKPGSVSRRTEAVPGGGRDIRSAPAWPPPPHHSARPTDGHVHQPGSQGERQHLRPHADHGVTTCLVTGCPGLSCAIKV